jgi:hypothetical protein
MAITLETFDRIRRFVLEHGDRQTYCNRYNHNPHFAFAACDAYLNPHPFNLDCDPSLGELTGLTLRIRLPQVRHLTFVRQASGVGFETNADQTAEELVSQILSEIARSGR